MLTLMIGSWVAHATEDPPEVAAPDWGAELAQWLVADGVAPEKAADVAAQMIGFEEGLPWQEGVLSLADDAVVLELGPGDRYLGAEGASAVLEAWGNPPDLDTEGLILPAGAHLFGADSWAVLLSYQDDGWIDDAEAATIDYDELLGEMKEGTRQDSEARREAGLDGIELVGWAEHPHYDAERKILYWAKTLQSDNGAQTLNYDVRALGRYGVFSMNALADPAALNSITVSMEAVRSQVQFVEGSRYADYEEGDRKAAYGIAALVAGGAIASKTGLLKGLFLMLVAAKKFVFVGVIAVLAAGQGVIRRMFGRSDPE